MEPQEGQEEPGRGRQQRWEAQWQEFLNSLHTPHLAWGTPHLSEAAPWDDAKAFLASFEQVAAACRWPRGEWVARLLPALSGEAQQAFSLLAARDKEDYGKVKAAILRGDALRREAQRQHFRQFCCPELGDPRRMYRQLQELCCQWLKPERHTKEQILELLILEQFLASLPVDVQGWIRAGGPDSGVQAVALLEDFLMSRTEAETGTWQEPLQDWAVGPLDVKEEPLDMVQGGICKEQTERFRDIQQNTDGEVAVPGTGIARSTLLLPPEDQDMAEQVELNKALGVQVEQAMNSQKMGLPLHVVEQTPVQPSQQTIFWKVLQEGGENVDSLGDGKRTQLKVNNSHLGGSDPVETPRRGPGRTQEKVLVTPEVKEERCEASREQGTEPLMGCKESDELTQGLGAACSNPSPVDSEGGKASFFKYDRMYHLLVPSRTGLVFEHTVEECSDSPPLGEKIQPRSKLGKHHRSHMEEKNHDDPEFGEALHSKSFPKHQLNHSVEKTYRCSSCGKCFSQSSDLLRHKMIHTGKEPHQCPECGKNFSYKSTLLTHQMVHTGEKPHRCPHCGKSFSQRSALVTHQMVHTGKKPHQCSVCGKTFSQRSTLIIHQNTHTGEKHHKCPTCGKGFAHRSSMLTHQMIHKGEKPYKCHTCGKSFSRRSYLSRHQKLHTGVKPHRCPNCGKSFSRRPYLLAHQIIHTGEKPHQCPECGKSFSRRSYFLTHQKLHTGQNPHQCPECGKSFCQRSDLIRHQKTHAERNLMGVLCAQAPGGVPSRGGFVSCLPGEGTALQGPRTGSSPAAAAPGAGLSLPPSLPPSLRRGWSCWGRAGGTEAERRCLAGDGRAAARCRSGARSKAVNEQTCEGLEAGSRGARKAPGRDQPESVMEPQEGQEEPGRGRQQHWKAQGQEFLKTPQTLHSAWGSPHLSEATPWDDATAFLASFEQVAAACWWPRGEWVARLLPALSGEAQQAFSLLAARDKEDYGKVKAAILRGEALRRERQRQHFRQFCCQEMGDPRKMYSQLQELCCQWLKPERHTKEQILELLVLEQFMASLPLDVQHQIWAGGPDSCAQAVALLEDFLVSRREANKGTWQEPLQEWAVGSLDIKEEPLDMVQEEVSTEQAERFRDTQQNVDEEVAVPGSGIARPSLLLPPGSQVLAETELNKALGIQVEQVMNPRKMGLPLHMVERTPMQSSQQTTFWKVLQEDGENVDSLEGSLGPQLGLAPNSVKKEEVFLPDPVQNLRPSGQESDDGKRTQLMMKNSQLGGNEPVETLRRGQGRTQEKVLVSAEVKEERCEANQWQGMQLHTGCKESSEITEGLGAACSNSIPLDVEGEKASFFKYGGWYHPTLGLVFEHIVDDCSGSPPLGEETQLKSKLDKHHSSYMEEKNLDCPEFGEALRSKSFPKHQVVHTAEKIYRCSSCGKSFSRHADLLRHKMIHTGKEPHQCSECGKNFSYKSTLLTHLMIHTGEKPHRCPHCGKSFSQRSALVTHQMIHTGKKPHLCSVCGKTFSQRSTLIIHQNTHTGEKHHKCPTCGKGFAHRSSMLTHQMIHKGEKPYKCHTCGKSFSRRSYLSRHQNIHTGVKPHRCPNCGKSFSRRSYLLSHQMIHTGEKPYQCPECGKNFCWKSQLLIHQMIHSGEKPHKCPSCGKSFFRRSDLLRHEMMHTGNKPHQCPECGRSFSQRSKLLTHHMMHTGQKPHKCPNCGKSFSRRSYLLAHQMIHTGNKPHQCQECGKSFSRRSYFLTHQKFHTGQKPHQCPDCGKSFCQRSDLLRHQKTHAEKNLTGVLCAGKA
ncbi:zinc finger protein 845-like [Tiliqua scincoides]|uniref:zinc finger protein 845-like n=1 Tax=Tiliqua scincoides TaxID=71010 RepID=UPI00346371DE